jgi:hypothetical protein
MFDKLTDLPLDGCAWLSGYSCSAVRFVMSTLSTGWAYILDPNNTFGSAWT